MSSTPELTLGKSSEIVNSVAVAAERLERMNRLNEYLEALEEERKKVEAFKRELPFCLQLLSHAIQISKEQLANCQHRPSKRQANVNRCVEDGSKKKSSNARPVFEEFIPLKNYSDSPTFEDEREDGAMDHTTVEKSNGLIQTKYWSQEEAYAHGEQMVSSIMEKPFKTRETVQSVVEPILGSQGRPAGAFLPFSRGLPTSGCRAGSATELRPDLAILVEDDSLIELPISSRGGSSEQAINQSKDNPTAAISNSSGQTYSPPQRKARRCWSPELHRRFVNALQQLGGSRVATPKQIRELMKVEGLTNDEVKSHLQKYRLHTRRPAPDAGFQSTAPPAPQLVVLGGIWVPDYVAHAAAAEAEAAQQAPSLFNPAQQVTHLHSPDSYRQLNATTQLQLHPSLYYGDSHGETTATQDHSEGSSRAGPHLTGKSSDAGREESVEEDQNEGSCWKYKFQDERISEVDESGHSNEGNLRGHKWRYCRGSGEDGSEAEDSRAYAIAV